MTSNTPAEVADRKDERKRKRGAVVKFSLAGAALLGIAAAATSASWSDNAWFTASAKGATVELQGAVGVSPTAWEDADGTVDAPAITIPASAFSTDLGNLLPGDVATVRLNVKNVGSTDLGLGTPTIDLGTGSLLSTSDNTKALVTVDAVPTAGQVLSEDEATYVTLTVTVPSDWAESNQSAAAQTLTVKFAGTAQH